MSRCLSLYLHCLALPPLCAVTFHLYKGEQGDLSVPSERLFINDLAFSIRMSRDICDGWPGTGCGVPQGAEPGPLALAPRLVSTVSRTLSASWIRSSKAGEGHKVEEREQQIFAVALDLGKRTTMSKVYFKGTSKFVSMTCFLFWDENNFFWQVRKLTGR